MPYWCTTHYCFYGEKQDIDILEQTIKNATSKVYTKSDFGTHWLGNLLYEIKLENKQNDISCRGQITEYDRMTDNAHDCIHVHTLEAWKYMPEIWITVIETLKLKSVKISFYTEDRSNDCYTIYDPHNLNYFIDTYHIAYSIKSGENNYFIGTDEETVEKLTDIITQITGQQPKSVTLDDLICEAYDLEIDCGYYIWINKINHINDPIYDPKII